MSINTEVGSFMFKRQGVDIEIEEEINIELGIIETNINAIDKIVVNKARKKKDLTLKDVEGVKDDLHRHLLEIRRLFKDRRGRDKESSSDDQELIKEKSDEESSDAEDDRALNRRIAGLKKMLIARTKMLRGEDIGDDLGDYGDEVGLGLGDEGDDMFGVVDGRDGAGAGGVV